MFYDVNTAFQEAGQWWQADNDLSETVLSSQTGVEEARRTVETKLSEGSRVPRTYGSSSLQETQ